MLRKKTAFFLIVSCILVLSVAIGAQLWDATFHPVHYTKTEPLESFIPREIPGWQCKDLPIAQTEELKGRVLDKLNLNDHLSRVYSKGNTEVILYVAYWEPLQMPVRQVGSHTPEVCWVLNGWECTEIRNNVFFPFQNGVLKSAEVRVLETQGNAQHVAYWHLIDGKVFKQNNKVGMWDRWNMLTDHFRFGLSQKPEQLFVRISANQPLESLWTDPGFQQLMEAVVIMSNLKVPDGEDPQDWTYRFII